MNWNAKKRRKEQLKEGFGKNPLKEIQVDWTRNRLSEIRIYHEEIIGKLQNQSEEQNVDDITWNDLEMDEIFLRINNTKSFMGEQVLYHKLHDVVCKKDWELEENRLTFLTQNDEKRVEIEERLSYIGKKEEDYHLATFLMHAELWKIESGVWLHFLQILLVVFMVGAILSDNSIWMGGLVSVAMINLFVYLRLKQQYEVFLFSLGSLKEIIKCSEWMLADKERSKLFGNEQVTLAVKELSRLAKQMLGWQTRKYASMTGDIVALMQDYLMGITLADVAAFNHIMKVLSDKQDKVLLLYEMIGEIDMTISIASFRKSVDIYCQPNIWDKQEIKGENIAHPLLENPVGNDFSLSKRAMITGANASGKSTFMKALAVNAILAQTVHTCLAKSFCMPRLHIMTSMSLRDDILSGESYYIREAKYLKRMIDQLKMSVPTLCVIDEILKGTNTEERLAASIAILKYLVHTNSFVLIATHDVELVEGMNESYEQYYFESQITENDILFDYRIRRGIGGKSNAIALLKLLDFPKEVIETAEKSVAGGMI